uniref:Uncharacterized protein n=1 Tax=Rhizophora mucronata TaxID=61149 RepID=A0A2P2IK02_RHIMU
MHWKQNKKAQASMHRDHIFYLYLGNK